MKVKFGPGKRTVKGFMPIAEVFFPAEEDGFVETDYLRFHRHDATKKAIMRMVSKQKYPSGTTVIARNWKKYADLIIEVR